MRTKNICATIFSFLLIVSFAPVAFAGSDKGREASEQHKSNAMNVVKDLAEIAGKDASIGEEVRVIAKEQESSSDRAAKAIQTVESRGGFRTFLIGTDYKNIGALRSEVVTTQNSIDRLTRAMDRATDDSVKADLNTQIKALQEMNTKVADFIKANESKFSLFGWLVKFLQ